MTEIVTVSNTKGGCGKSTGAMNFSRCSAIDEKRTLLIDLDPNNTTTDSLGLLNQMLPSVLESHSAKRAFEDDEAFFSDLAFPTAFGYDVVMGLFGSEVAELRLGAEADSAAYLADMLSEDEELHIRYDRVFIDTGGRAGKLLHSAIFASDKVITPTKVTRFDTDQVKKFAKFLKKVAKQKSRYVDYVDRPVEWSKIYFNEVDTEVKASIKSIENFVAEFEQSQKISEHYIPKSGFVPAAELKYQHVVDYRPNSNVAKEFLALYNEIFQSNLVFSK